MLIDKKRYKNTLTDLWQKVFSDSRDYVELIFDFSYDENIICFAEIEDEKAVSAFYLLESEILLEGESFKGYYLYAAATLPSHRSKGLMSKLIGEALEYCKKEGFDFISLVPSEKSLYDYYSRFGFLSRMYKNNIELFSASAANSKLIPINAEEYFSVRLKCFGNMFTFSEKTFGYAVRCLRFSGFDFYKDEQGVHYLYNTDEGELIEAVSSSVKSEEKEKAGMLCPLNDKLEEKLKFKEIYMNIALD